MDSEELIISVLTEEQQAELKEFDAIFAHNGELAAQVGKSAELAKNFEDALLKACEAFGDAAQEPRLIVVSKDMADILSKHDIKPEGLVITGGLPSIDDAIDALNDLAPQDVSTYTKQRKGKGERKRASRQQRKQWRR